jgi:hypothetical protein
MCMLRALIVTSPHFFQEASHKSFILPEEAIYSELNCFPAYHVKVPIRHIIHISPTCRTAPHCFCSWRRLFSSCSSRPTANLSWMTTNQLHDFATTSTLGEHITHDEIKTSDCYLKFERSNSRSLKKWIWLKLGSYQRSQNICKLRRGLRLEMRQCDILICRSVANARAARLLVRDGSR